MEPPLGQDYLPPPRTPEKSSLVQQQAKPASQSPRPRNRSRVGLMTIGSRLLILGVSLKTSFCATQAHFNNHKIESRAERARSPGLGIWRASSIMNRKSNRSAGGGRSGQSHFLRNPGVSGGGERRHPAERSLCVLRGCARLSFLCFPAGRNAAKMAALPEDQGHLDLPKLRVRC